MMKKKLLIALPVLLLAGIALLCYAGRFRTYSSYLAYIEDDGRVPFLPQEGAKNLRFVQRRLLLSKLYMYAFTLPEDTAAQFEDTLTDRYHLDTPEPEPGTAAYWYGKTAGECADPDEGLDAFPLHLPFSRITDRDITGAAVLVYYPAGTGSRSYGILKFPDTREYICFEYLSR